MSRSQKQYASFRSLAPKDNTPKYTCVEIEDLKTRKKILSENMIVCIDLWAPWCEPCKIVSPQFAELAQQYNQPGRCMLVKENVDLELTRNFQITAIPAFIFYVKGNLLSNDKSPICVLGGSIDEVKKILDDLLQRVK